MDRICKVGSAIIVLFKKFRVHFSYFHKLMAYLVFIRGGLLFNGPEVVSPASDKAKLFAIKLFEEL